MRFFALLFALLLLTTLPTAAQAPSTEVTPEAAVPPEAVEFGRVSGIVLMSSGTPVGGAHATLTSPDGSVSYAVNSRDDGTFLFEGIDPADYTLHVSKGALEMIRPDSLHVTVTAGESRDGMVLTLGEFSSISGRVSDPDGNPAAAAVVVAVSYGVGESGQRTITDVKAVPTDAQGNYSIRGVPSGSYYVFADPPQETPEGDVNEMPDGSEQMVRTFYPNSLDRAGAIRVVIGEEHATPQNVIDLRIRQDRVYFLEGLVVGPTGAPLPKLGVRLNPAEGSFQWADRQETSTDVTGRFRFENLLPGHYRIASFPNPQYQGVEEVSIGRQSVSDVELRVYPIPDLPVRIRMADGQPPDKQIRVTLWHDRYLRSALIPPDGYGAIEEPIVGQLPVRIYDLPENVYVQAVRYGGQDITRSYLNLNGETNGGLVIVLEQGAGKVSGVLANSRGEPLQGLVTLLPDQAGPPLSVRGIQLSSAGADGIFEFAGVAPGNYVLTGWPILEDRKLAVQMRVSILTDDAFRAQFRSQSERISVKPGASVYQTLEPVSPEAVEQQLAIAP